jgi:hypothetical protein
MNEYLLMKLHEQHLRETARSAELRRLLTVAAVEKHLTPPTDQPEARLVSPEPPREARLRARRA